MVGIQSTNGIVSGIDIQGTVNQLINLAAAPRTRLVNANKQLETEQVALTSLTALVVGVQLSTDRLGQKSLYSTATASSSNTSLIKVSVTGSPAAGNHSFIPVRQASAQQLTSSLFASKDQKVGEGEVVIHRGGFLDESVNLDQLNGGAGVDRGSIRINDRSGVSKTIDLRFALTINDVVETINKTDGLNVVASVSGDRIKLTDTSTGTELLSVSEVGGGTTAADLGLAGVSTSSNSAVGNSIQSLTARTSLSSLLDKRGLVFPPSGTSLEFSLRDGSTIEFDGTLNSNNASVGELLSAINSAGDGKLEARIAADKKSIEFVDLTSGANNFTIDSPDGALATQLGINRSVAGSTITSGQLIAGLNDTLLSSLNGGQGLGTLGSITITDRNNSSATVDLSTATTLGTVIDRINQSGVGVRAQLNRTRTGIEIVDSTGSTSHQLRIANVADTTNTATKLKIEAAVSADSIDSGSLNRQWINDNTLIKNWNNGKGLSLGSIRFTDSSGKQSTLNLSALAPKTVGDVLKAINKLSVGVDAKINATGDGILLVDSAGGTGQLQVTDIGASLSAKQLGIAGTAESLTVGNATVSGIDGSQTLRITTTATTTLAKLTEEINKLDGPVSATQLTFGNSEVRLVLNGTSTGAAGRVTIGSNLNLGFSETVKAKDALVAYGASNSSGGVLVTSATNQFDDVIEGVKFEVLGESPTPVTIAVSKNSDNLSKQLRTVVEQYNKIRDKLKTDANYDPQTKSAGILFGTNAVVRLDLAFGNLFTGQIRGAGSITSITQLGIRLNDQGKLEFDESKLTKAIENDPQAVEEFFTKEKTGFSARAKDIADSLAGTKNGALLARTQAIKSKIDQNNLRINNFGLRLEKQRTRLLTQFYNLEIAISKNQDNLKAINSIQNIAPLTNG